MALAHDLYGGNPSLEWPGASKKTVTKEAKAGELSLSPIEPTPTKGEGAKTAQAPYKEDHSKVDDVEEQEKD